MIDVHQDSGSRGARRGSFNSQLCRASRAARHSFAAQAAKLAPSGRVVGQQTPPPPPNAWAINKIIAMARRDLRRAVGGAERQVAQRNLEQALQGKVEYILVGW